MRSTTLGVLAFIPDGYELPHGRQQEVLSCTEPLSTYTPRNPWDACKYLRLSLGFTLYCVCHAPGNQAPRLRQEGHHHGFRLCTDGEEFSLQEGKVGIQPHVPLPGVCSPHSYMG